MDTQTADQQTRIRTLNDQFRRDPAQGKVHITDGAVGIIYQLGLQSVLKQIADYAGFDDGNDPYKEHDFGSLAIGAHKVWWKIDYYGLDLESGSQDPGDKATTTRVMTIMTPEEY